VNTKGVWKSSSQNDCVFSHYSTGIRFSTRKHSKCNELSAKSLL